MGDNDITPEGKQSFIQAVRSGEAWRVRSVVGQFPSLRSHINANWFDLDAPAIVFSRKNREMVEALLELGADINARGQFWGRSVGVLDDVGEATAEFLIAKGAERALPAFAEALKAGDVEATRKLLAENPTLKQHLNRSMFSFGGRPITHSKKNIPMVDLLLEYGADINLKTDWWAGGFGVLDGVDAQLAAELVARGARMDIFAAAEFGAFDQVKEFVEKDPSLVHELGGDGKRPLHYASTRQIIDFLLEHGAEIDARDIDHHSTAAQYAVNEAWKCRYLVERGAGVDIFMAAALGDSALTQRAMDEDPTAIAARIGKPGYAAVPQEAGGAIYNWLLGGGMYAHEVAKARGHMAIYDLLMSRTPERLRFAIACSSGDGPVVKELLAANANLVNELDEDGRKMLARAAWRNNIDAVRVMLDAGFGVDWRDDEGTPLDRACVRGYLPIVELLLSRGASLEEKNVYGGMPLGACIWGSLNFRDRAGDYPGVMEKLLAAGAKRPERAEGSAEVREVLRRSGKKM